MPTPSRGCCPTCAHCGHSNHAHSFTPYHLPPSPPLPANTLILPSTASALHLPLHFDSRKRSFTASHNATSPALLEALYWTAEANDGARHTHASYASTSESEESTTSSNGQQRGGTETLSPPGSASPLRRKAAGQGADTGASRVGRHTKPPTSPLSPNPRAGRAGQTASPRAASPLSPATRAERSPSALVASADCHSAASPTQRGSSRTALPSCVRGHDHPAARPTCIPLCSSSAFPSASSSPHPRRNAKLAGCPLLFPSSSPHALAAGRRHLRPGLDPGAA